ncbi:MAG: hypothetical protein II075_01025 [Bacteroidales bacterium]|nr:hypothetical protein [Bacteroidales bacterium]
MIDKLLDIYNRLQLKLFMIPFLNIDRERFLRRQVGDAEADEDVIRRRCRRLIVICCFVTSLITFLCTLPSNIWISIPLILIDFEQFQFFVFVIQQELLYLYGLKDLREDQRRIVGDNAMFLIWLQNEVMLSSGDSIRLKIKTGVGFVVRKSITLLVTKSPFRIVVLSGMRQFLKWCGVIATHQLLDVSVDLLVCIVCALIAALVSLWQFYPMCRKLRDALESADVNEYYQQWNDCIDKIRTAE